MTELHELRMTYRILEMADIVTKEISPPPNTLEECIFAQTTMTVSANLSTKISHCQFGVDPDWEHCARSASMGLDAVGPPPRHRPLPARSPLPGLLQNRRNLQSSSSPKPIIQIKPSPFEIL
jgi:hypothetical protein